MKRDHGVLKLSIRGGMALVAVCAWLLPSVAHAAPTIGGSGIDWYWGNEGAATQTIGGKFHNAGPRGLAVYDATGDVFVADTGNNRIQQFDKDGTFIRTWGQDVLSNGAGSVGFETCSVIASCKNGINSGTVPVTGGAMNNPSGLAVNQANGHIYVVDSGSNATTGNRVQEFRIDDNGTPANPADDFAVFVRAWGQDVINNGAANNGFEVCGTASECKAGTAGSSGAVATGSTGGVLNLPTGGSTTSASGLAVAPVGAPNAGNVLVADPNAARIQEFTAAGAFVRAFGGGVVNGGAEGTGDLNGTTTISNVQVTSKAFMPGQTVTSPGGGIAAGTRIVAVGSGPSTTITLSQAATKSESGATLVVAAGSGNQPNNERQTVTLGANTTGGTFTLTVPESQGFAAVTTDPIDYNASPGTLKGLLEAKAPSLVGNVEVTGASGGPYTIEFKGKLADTNVAQLTTNPANLTVGSGAKSAVVATPVEGASGFEECVVAAECQAGVSFVLGRQEGNGAGRFAEGAVRSVAEDKDGNIYAVEARYAALAGESNFRVQKFTLPGNVVTPQGTFACAALCGTTAISSSPGNRDNPFEVAVDGSGYVYVTKAFRSGEGQPPVVLAPFSAEFQQRVLKVDPATGEVVRAFLVNPGRFNLFSPSQAARRPVHNATGLTGLAVADAGLPLYVTDTPSPGTATAYARVYRVKNIGGLTATLSTSEVAATGATLEAAITPAATKLDTYYYFQYSRAGFGDWSEFRAPTAVDTEDVGVDIGNGTDGGESSECSPNTGKRAALCHVSQVIDGLERDRAYEFRLVASTEANGLLYTSDPVEFETAATRPSVTTGVAVWSGPPASGPSLTFNGTVNPQGDQTHFYFEYGDQGPCSANPCQAAPVFPRDVGHGGIALDVNATVSRLDPAHTFNYRIVAVNPQGTSVGADRVVAPPQPTDRFIELVSDGDSHGTGVYPVERLAVSDDGDRASFAALAFGEQESSPSLSATNVARRGENGWQVSSLAPGISEPTVFRDRDELALGADVEHMLWLSRPSPGVYRWMSKDANGGYGPVSPLLTPLQRSGTEADRFVLRGASLDQSTIVFANNSSTGGKTFLPDEPLVSGGNLRYSNLYAIHGAGGPNPALGVVNRSAGGSVLGGACGARLGADSSLGADSLVSEKGETTRAVSADGSVIYFSSRNGSPSACDATAQAANPVRIFKRVNGTSTVEVSACAKTPPATCTAEGDDAYAGASADGSRVYFITNRQLVDSDTNSGTPTVNCGEFSLFNGCDLYLYDSTKPTGQKLAQVSLGAAGEVMGVVDVSMDGSRVYFVAKGVLTGANGESKSPQLGKPNLYVFERGESDELRFLATLSDRASAGQTDRPDSGLWSTAAKGAYALPYYQGSGVGRVDGDGHLLLFTTEMPLLPSVDTDSVRDVYRYDDTAPADKRLICLSCAGNLPFPAVLFERQNSTNSGAATVQEQRVASEDGSSVVFLSSEQLLDADTNTAPDIYLWRQGQGLSLVSAATGSRGVQGGRASGFSTGIELGPVISPDGDTVFFLTRATILPRDKNNDAYDWYAARVGGGFREAEGASDPCKEVARDCQGPHVDPPPPPGPLSSEGPSSGNVPRPKPGPKPCPKGKHRVKGANGKTRCVAKKKAKKKARAKQRKKAKKKARAKQRVSHDRRAGR